MPDNESLQGIGYENEHTGCSSRHAGLMQQEKQQVMYRETQHLRYAIGTIFNLRTPYEKNSGGALKIISVGDTTTAYWQTIYKRTALFLRYCYQKMSDKTAARHRQYSNLRFAPALNEPLRNNNMSLY